MPKLIKNANVLVVQRVDLSLVSFSVGTIEQRLRGVSLDAVQFNFKSTEIDKERLLTVLAHVKPGCMINFEDKTVQMPYI